MSDVKPLIKTDFKNIPSPQRGKVRDIFDFGNMLLIVTTDRISAYDHILPNGIPGKGIVLNKISEFWFNRTKDLVENHMLSTEVDDFPEEFHEYRNELEGRSMLVKKTTPLAIECIVRGYISGSGWSEYKATGSICGIDLPDDLSESSVLNSPIFTPSTKASEGQHDQNITFKEAVQIIGKDKAVAVRDLSLEIYREAREYANDRGIIIADTKFEFGINDDGEPVLIDEVLTPDSSRFWPKDEYEPGRAQRSFDKQFVRDYLNSINWDRKPPVPELPEEIVRKTKEKYESMLIYFS